MSLYENLLQDPRFGSFTLEQKRTAASLALDEDLAADPRLKEWEPDRILAAKESFLDDQFSKDDRSWLSKAGEAVSNIPETATAMGKGVVEAVGYGLPALAGQYKEELFDKNPMSKDDWADRMIERKAQRDSETIQQDGKGLAFPPVPGILPEGITQGDVAQSMQSLPFSGAGMAGGLVGRGLGLASPVPGGAAAGAIAGSTAALTPIALNSVKRQLLGTLQEQLGQRPTEEQAQALLDDFDESIKRHAAGEVLPEAIGNAFEIGFLSKMVGKTPAGQGLVKNLAGKAFEGVKSLGTELGTETITTQIQQPEEVKMGLRPGEEARTWSGSDVVKSLQEVAPQTVVMQGGITGAASALGLARRSVGDVTDQARNETAAVGGDALAQAKSSAQAQSEALTNIANAGTVDEAIAAFSEPIKADQFNDIQAEEDQKVKQSRLEAFQAEKFGGPRTAQESAHIFQQAPKTEPMFQAELKADDQFAEQQRLAKKQADLEYALGTAEDDKDIAGAIRSEIRGGQGGQRVKIEGRTEDTTIGVPTTNAPFLQKDNIRAHYIKQGLAGDALDQSSNRINRTTALITLHNVEVGKPLSPVQQEVWNYLKETKGQEITYQGKDIDEGLNKIENAGLEIGKPQTLAAGYIEEGDKVVIDKGGVPDVFTSKGIKNGEVVLEDGVTVRVDPFDDVTVLAHKKAPQEQKIEAPGVMLGAGESLTSTKQGGQNGEETSKTDGQEGRQGLLNNQITTESQTSPALTPAEEKEAIPNLPEDLKITMPVEIAGEVHQVEYNANEELTAAKDEASQWEKLLNCVKKSKLASCLKKLDTSGIPKADIFDLHAASLKKQDIDFLRGKAQESKAYHIEVMKAADKAHKIRLWDDMPGIEGDYTVSEIKAIGKAAGASRTDIFNAVQESKKQQEEKNGRNKQDKEGMASVGPVEKQDVIVAEQGKGDTVGDKEPAGDGVQETPIEEVTPNDKETKVLEGREVKPGTDGKDIPQVLGRNAEEEPPAVGDNAGAGKPEVQVKTPAISPDTGKVRYSASDSTKTGTIIQQVTEEITTGEYGKAAQRLIDEGKLKVVQSVEEVPVGGRRTGSSGVYHKGVVYLVADGMDKEEAESVMLHESFHRAKSQGDFKQIMDELGRLDKIAQGNGEISKWFAKAREAAQVDKDSPHYLEEIAAYSVQQYEESPNLIKRWVDKLIAKAKVILMKTFGLRIGKLDPAMLREIAVGGLRAGIVKQAGGDTVYSRQEIIEHAKAFFSKLQQVAAEKFQGMKAQSVEPFLLKQGVKKAEIEATGVREWLAAKKQTDRVDQAELLDFVAANTVELEDVVLGVDPEIIKRAWLVEKTNRYNGFDVSSEEATKIVNGRDDDKIKMWYGETTVGEVRSKFNISPEYNKVVDDTKFSDYQEPGAVEGSYREMFVTAPPSIEKQTSGAKYRKELWRKFDAGEITKSERDIGLEGSNPPPEWNDGHSQYNNILNPIVRIRFNEVTDTAGRRILRIEEIQGPSADNQQKMPAYLRDNIYQLGVKRILAYAKANGFDGVALATKPGMSPGSTQADRYSLERQVDAVKISKNGENSFDVVALKDRRGGETQTEQFSKKGLSLKELESNTGKELAKKAQEQDIGEKTYSGVDLRVGGEGLKRLYDEQLPRLFEAYGKGKMVATRTPAAESKQVLVEKVYGVGEKYENLPESAQVKIDSMLSDRQAAMPFIPITPDTPTSYPLFSRKTAIEDAFDTPEQHSLKSTIDNVFSATTINKETIAEKASKFRTTLIDKLHPVEQLGELPYRLHSILNNSHAVFSTFLQHGNLSWEDQALIVKSKDNGFLPWLHSLKDDGRKLFYWVAVKRAEKLESEGRENWLTPDKRKAIKAELFEGLTPIERLKKETEYSKLNDQFQKWNQNIIDTAIEAGLISKEQSDSWMRDFYLPFYRILEDETTKDEFLQGPHKSRKFISAQIKRLEGGEEKIGDPLENILKNWFHLITESQRNVARKAADDVAISMGLAEVVPGNELFKSPGARRENFIVSHQDNGKAVFVKHKDPDLFEALSNANSKVFDSTLMRIMSGAKRVLTAGATFTPAFRVANLLRDTVHSSVVSKNFTPFIDTAKGFAKVWKESPEYVALMASGGGFGDGYIESGDPKAMARSIEKILAREGKGIRGNILDTPRRMLEFWQRIGVASEMAARVQLYSNLKEKGATHLEASFKARDLLDFFKSGAGNSVRVIMATTPFLNARIQGLDRLYRGAAEDPKAFFTKGAIVAGASLLLWAMFKDDDRYKELEDFEKWQYHHFWIGDNHFRIPKAFEVGAIFSSLFESAANVLDGQEDIKFFGRFLAHTLFSTFSLNFPAAFGPGIEVWANKSSYTGREIESFAMRRLPSGERANLWTPEMLKDIGRDTGISPIKMEYLIKGHTAAFGLMFLTVADKLYREATGAPPRPANTVEDIPGLGRFIKESEPRNTKYATRYYEFAKEVDELAMTISNYKSIGDIGMARKIAEENKKTLKYKKFVNKTKIAISGLRKREKLVWSSEESPETKRAKLRELTKKKNKLLQNAYREVYK